MFRKSMITVAAAMSLFAATGVASAQNYSQQNSGQQNYGQQSYNAAAQGNGQQARPQMDLSSQILQGARTSRGQYFQFALGPSFQALQESTNAVIIGSQQLCSVYGLFGWIGIQGMQTPDQFASLFAKDMQFQNLQVVGTQPIAPTQGFQAAKYYEYTYTADGRPCRGACVVNANASGCGAVQFVGTAADRWDSIKPALFKLAMSVGACGANTFGAQDQFAATRPRGNYGIGDWHPTSSVTPGIERAWRDGSDATRGQDTVNDGRGTTYQPTWDQYDYSRGGYVDPNDPTRVLQQGASWDPR